VNIYQRFLVQKLRLSFQVNHISKVGSPISRFFFQIFLFFGSKILMVIFQCRLCWMADPRYFLDVSKNFEWHRFWAVWIEVFQFFSWSFNNQVLMSWEDVSGARKFFGKIFFGKIYALPHNLSKKGLYGMKPSSSSLSANSSRSLMVSSLGISSPKLVKKFSSSANIMVPFSFLS